jgi:2-polyprenyl-6-methoxyphenol hydroxylase-like FAD-dependent oxidoreductase
VAYDVIIVGGGLAGSSLAIALAPLGARILIVEHQERFRDRIRGEVLMPWGSLEAKRLGIYDFLLKSCAIEVAYYTRFRPGAPAAVRDLAATTPANTRCMTFSHPAMQEVLLARAASLESRSGAARRSPTSHRVTLPNSMSEAMPTDSLRDLLFSPTGVTRGCARRLVSRSSVTPSN